MAKDTWFTLDLPVLDAIVTYFEEIDEGLRPQLYDIAEITGFDEEDVIRAAGRLDGVYIDLQRVMGPQRLLAITDVTPEARVATGQWPSAESLAARIIAGLEAAAEGEPDEVKRGRLREAVDVLGSTVKDLSTNLLATVIARQMGLS